MWITPRPQTGTVVLMTHFPVGARTETETNNGISHFLEHMVFTGTERWDEAEVTDLVRRHGGDYNAQTSREETIYFLHIPAQDLTFGMDWMHEVLFRPSLAPDKFEKERQVIINEKGGELDRWRKAWEWLEDYNFGWSIPRAVRRRLYPESSLLLPIIGTDQSLKRITHEMLRTYYRQFYVPNHMTLLIVGDVDPDEALAQAEATFGHLQARVIPPTHPQNQVVSRPFHIQIKGPTPNDQGQFFMGALLDSSRHAERFVWWAIIEMLDNVYLHDIRYTHGLSYGVNVFPVLYTDTGYLAIHTSAEVEDFPLIRDLVQKHLQRLVEGDFSQTELDEAKTALKGRALLSIQDNLECAWWLCSDILSLPTDDLPYPDYIEEITKISPDDIQRVAQQYLTTNKLFSVEHRPILTPRRLRPLVMSAAGLGATLFFARQKRKNKIQ